jgi:iron complex transport system permease protein
MPTRARLALALLAALFAAAVLLRVLVGAGGLAWPESPAVWELRGLRVALGAVVGVALAVAGVLMQTLLRNPLASPELLGASSGATLAILVAAYAGAGVAELSTLGGLAWQGAPAMLGACGALALVYALSQRRGIVEPATLILVGVIIAVMCSAGVMLVQHLMGPQPGGLSALLIGSLGDSVPAGVIAVCGGLVFAATVLAVMGGRAMDASSLDDHEARSVGVRLGRLRTALFLGAGALTAVAVMLAGPIGFVGLVCPHLVRLAMGPAAGGRRGLHAPLVAGAALSGAALVIGADALVKGVDLGSGRLPIGVLTALLGGPVLILLLRRGRAGRA